MLMLWRRWINRLFTRAPLPRRNRRPNPRRTRLGVELLEDRSVPTVSFLGVSSGDVSSTDPIVWTRATDDASPGAAVNLPLQYSTDNTFASFSSAPVTTSTAAAGDNTAKYDITGLTPGTVYFYRFFVGPDFSNVGT